MAQSHSSYFSHESGTATRTVYIVLAALTALYSVVSILAPLIAPTCTIHPKQEKSWLNPDYSADPCLRVRYLVLLGLTKARCSRSSTARWRGTPRA